MANVITQALEILDRFSQVHHAQEQEFGTGFAPMNDRDFENLLTGGLKNATGIDQPHIDLGTTLPQLEQAFLASLTDEQRQLRDAFKAIVDEMSQRQANGEDWESVVASGLVEEQGKAMQEFYRSLSPEQQEKQQKISNLRLLANMGEEHGEDALSKLISEIQAPIRHKFSEGQQVLSIELPMQPDFYGLATAVITEALQRQGIAINNDDDNPAQEGYAVWQDFAGRGENIKINLVKTENAPPIDFDALKEEIAGSIKTYLSAPANWKKVRSTRGITYEHESPVGTEDLIDALLHIQKEVVDPKSEDIRMVHRANGKIITPDDPEFIAELPPDTTRVVRVSGASIRGVLQDKLSVQGLQTPPITQVS